MTRNANVHCRGNGVPRATLEVWFAGAQTCLFCLLLSDFLWAESFAGTPTCQLSRATQPVRCQVWELGVCGRLDTMKSDLHGPMGGEANAKPQPLVSPLQLDSVAVGVDDTRELIASPTTAATIADLQSSHRRRQRAGAVAGVTLLVLLSVGVAVAIVVSKSGKPSVALPKVRGCVRVCCARVAPVDAIRSRGLAMHPNRGCMLGNHVVALREWGWHLEMGSVLRGWRARGGCAAWQMCTRLDPHLEDLCVRACAGVF